MYNKIGEKIEILAEAIAWLGILISVFVGMYLMASDEDLVGVGVLIMIIGGLGSWIGSFILYGFGQLIENSEILVSKLSEKEGDFELLDKDGDMNEKIEELNTLLKMELITKEEYEKKIRACKK